MKRIIVLLAALLCAHSAYAVIQQQVSVVPTDKPAVRTATVSFSSGDVEVDDDGDIVITYSGDNRRGGVLTVTPVDGSPINVTIPANAAVVALNLRNGTALPQRGSSPTSRPSDNPIRLGVTYGMATGDIPAITSGLGESESAGQERTVLPSEDEFDLDIAGLTASFPVFGNATLTLHAASGDGDDEGAATIAPGGINAYAVATGDVPGVGTGAFFGSAGGMSWSSHEYDYDKFQIGFGVPCDLFNFSENSQTIARVDLTFARFDQEFDAMNAPISISGVSHMLHQKVDSDLLQLRLGMDWVMPIDNVWSISLGGGLSYQRLDSDFKSHEEFDLFGSVSSLNLRDDETENDFGGHVRAGVNADLGRFTLGLNAMYESGLSTPGIRNLNSGDDNFLNGLVSGLTSEDSDNLYYALTVGVKL